jgi:hypothetical protein
MKNPAAFSPLSTTVPTMFLCRRRSEMARE